LIAADIGAVIDGEGSVYSDPKLLVFILKQLIINCAKYCPGCRIEIRIDADTLVFSDSGPGIPAHELCRVTERGFTGGAARNENRGTGMGLYIVRVLCEKLHIDMEIASEVGLFTRFTFRFPT
ncbi:MAG: ATP-binding protein, partial [Eubacteriales bacterium]